MTNIHRHRETAESFSGEASRYDRARPGYPSALIDRVVAAGPGRSLLDVGCGTGIASRLFQAAGCTVLGVDVDPRMAATARECGIECEVAKFEDWDPAGRSFDILTAAQTWHWIDPAAGATKAAQALRPGGRIALFWNAFEPPATLRRALGEVQARILPTAPNMWTLEGSIADGYARMVAAAATGLAATGCFDPVEEWRFEWDHVYTTESWLDVLPTFGGMGSRLPAPQLQAVLDGNAEVIDAAGGSFTMHYSTFTATTIRNGEPTLAESD